MPFKDPEVERANVRERKRRYLLKKKIQKFGVESVGVNMRGRHGNHARGSANGQWRGGRFITSHGYVAVRVPPDHPHAWGAHPAVKYAYEHILIVETGLGRSLTKDERVHHKNENKTDNRWPENLEALTESEHMRGHARANGWTPEWRALRMRTKAIWRTQIARCLRDHTDRIHSALGYSGNQLRQHLESNWQPGMNWENYGYRGWHVDHIEPLSSFPMVSPGSIVSCLANLQPLWHRDNIRKNARNSHKRKSASS